MQVTQRCPRCELDLTQSSFHPDKWGKPGHYCRPCVVEYKRAWRRSRGIGPRRERQSKTPKPPTPLSTNYCTVHARVRRQRGRASEYTCARCPNQAEEWAYDHTDPNPVRGTTARGRMAEYSMDVNRYLPMCKRCHAKFDANRSERVTVDAPAHRVMTHW